MRINYPKKIQSLEEEILLLMQMGKEKSLSISEILHILSGKGRPLILILLSLPFCQPIQIPGLSPIFGLAIAIIGLRMTFGKGVWLPQMLLKKEISSDTLIKIGEKAFSIIRKMKPWIHPRFLWLCDNSFLNKGNGLIIYTLGILLALPLPIPMSNITAAWSIFLIAFGLLENDGVFIIIGYILSLVTFVFFLALLLGIQKVFFMYTARGV